MNKAEYDAELVKIPFYTKRQYMKPWVGERYESGDHRRLLLVAESHFVGLDTRSNIDAWYDGSFSLNGYEDWCTPGITIRNAVKTNVQLRQMLCEVLGNGISEEEAVQEIAFYDYWLRPAYWNEDKQKPEPFKPLRRDRKEAIQNFLRVVETLRPEYIVFVSWMSVRSAERDYRRFRDQPEKELWECLPKYGCSEYRAFTHPSRWENPPRGRQADYYHRLGIQFEDRTPYSARDYCVGYLKQQWLRPNPQ